MMDILLKKSDLRSNKFSINEDFFLVNRKLVLFCENFTFVMPINVSDVMNNRIHIFVFTNLI